MELVVFIIIVLTIVFLLSGRNKRETRRKPPFKKRYELDQVQPVIEFENKMVNGMFSESREVFVAAFANDTHVLKVTATIGSKYSCSASDDVNSWGAKAVKIGATRIRQYHNHPHEFGRSFPSRADKRGHRALKPVVEQWGVKYQSFLVYKSWLGRAKIKEYH